MRALGDIRRRRIAEAVEIETEDAKRAGALGFFPRLFCQVGMPQANPAPGEPWRRDNGLCRLSMVGDPDIGLPWGKIARVLVCYIITEAVRKGSPKIDLGPTLSHFLAELGMGSPTGGRTGNIARVRDQIRRLTTTTVHATIDVRDDLGRHVWRNMPLVLARDVQLCWHTRQVEQGALWPSYIDLTDEFFRMARERPVPIDRRALKVLSVMGLDLYLWLTYRMSYLDTVREIPWSLLEKQFGANYRQLSEFRRHVIARLPEVLDVYPQLRLAVGDSGLILRPSPPHIPPST